MRAGRLRDRLELYAKESTQNAYGEAIVTITLQSTVWGSVESLSGRELFAQQQVQSEARVKIILRYSGAALTPAWVIKHPLTGLFYDIEAVINTDLANREWIVMTRQGVSEDQYSVT